MYNKLSAETENLILKDKNLNKKNVYAFNSEPLRRKNNPHDKGNAVRSDFIRDIDKIMNCPYFSRYQDKTQVFSLYKNDDITRRSLHVQLVSRIARTIGKALNLNTELIEAIALGHDIGHTPFGHSGEKILDELFFEKTGRRFFHNLHSVRVLDKIFPFNLTLPTLNGILSHNGELELEEYRPRPIGSFDEFDKITEKCYTDDSFVFTLLPDTLEGCVVRISDIIAYLGKDRQDAVLTETAKTEDFTDGKIGLFNAEIINNIENNVIENSYGKPYIKMDKDYFDALKLAKKENYRKIYFSDKTKSETDKNLRPMMTALYNKLLSDLLRKDENSFIYRHHINYVNRTFYKRDVPYLKTEPNQIVVDYIASMTDDYFIDLFKLLFPDSGYSLDYVDYFKDKKI